MHTGTCGICLYRPVIWFGSIHQYVSIMLSVVVFCVTSCSDIWLFFICNFSRAFKHRVTGHALLRSDWKDLCNGYDWHHFTCECFGVSIVGPQHCTGLLFAGKLLNLHSGVPTDHNQPQSIVVWSFKGIFFLLLISSGHLVIPKNGSSCCTLCWKGKALQLLQSYCKQGSEAIRKGNWTHSSTRVFKWEILLLLNPRAAPKWLNQLRNVLNISVVHSSALNCAQLVFDKVLCITVTITFITDVMYIIDILMFILFCEKEEDV